MNCSYFKLFILFIFEFFAFSILQHNWSADFSIRDLFGVRTVSAHTTIANKGYEAELSSEISNIILEPNATKTITLKFKNNGGKSWSNSGVGYVSLYTNPSTRQSLFFDKKDWFNNSQPAVLIEKKVPTGSIGTFTFVIRAPNKEGIYNEKFKLAAENIAWIKNAEVTIPITVVSKKTQAMNEKIVPKNEMSIVKIGDLSGKILIKSNESILAQGGQPVFVRFGIKNTGSKSWRNIALIESGVMLANVTKSPFYDVSWPESRVALSISNEEYLPGRLALLSVTLRAPTTVGNHILKLKLTSDNIPVDGTDIELPVTVTTPGPDELNGNELPLLATSTPTWIGVKEPMMRVGITQNMNAKIKVNIQYRILDGEGKEYGTLAQDTVAELYFDEATEGQALIIGDMSYQTNTYFRLEPTNMTEGLFTLISFENRPKWNKSLNDNVFRGIFEMRKNKAGYVWITNELPIEYYLRGLNEISNSWPIEAHKALVVAARSYAMYYIEHNGKHSGSSHFLNAGSYDQVYDGYNAELRNPRVSEAVDSTRGIVVRYDGITAITPYFSRSNGKTKTWSQVWGGKGFPYLQSRIAQYDKAKGFGYFGHGVGMPQTDAALRAQNEGVGFEDILKAYYTDVTIDRVYE